VTKRNDASDEEEPVLFFPDCPMELEGEVFSLHWADPGLGVLIAWDRVDGRLEPVGVTIERRPDGELGVLNSDMIRRLPFGSLVKQARERAADGSATVAIPVHLTGNEVDFDEAGGQFRFKIEEAEQLSFKVDRSRIDHRFADGINSLSTGSRRGSALDEDMLRNVAEVYRRAWGMGIPVTAAVADAFHIAKSTAAKRIMKARAAGLLDDIQPIRKGG
jgi:hypothetical protein